MSSQVSQTSAATQRRAEEPYIPVEELAQRLDLPLAILLRRIEAGDVPARRQGTSGSGWELRLSDLGIDPEEREEERQQDEEDEHAMSDDPGISTDPPPPPMTASAGTPHEETPAAETPVVETPEAETSVAETPAAGMPRTVDERRYSWSPAWHARSTDSRSADQSGGDPLPAEAHGTERRPDEPVAILPGRITRYERGTRGPRSEVAGMVIDSRELVSGLLDRWERTLEQRIFIEQRQRFESELNARQNLVKQLQLELQTARAEHAAYAADRDRQQLELEHQIADLHRELAAANDALLRRRGGLFHRR